MHAKRKKQLLKVLAIVTIVACVVGLVLYALKAQTNYFYSPAQIKAGEAEGKKRLKAGGMVVKGSLQREKNSLKVHFLITDYKATIPVEYSGILPDLFKEGSGVVGTGRIENGVFVAEEILAKHDENYMPPEVAKTLSKQGEMPQGQFAK